MGFLSRDLAQCSPRKIIGWLVCCSCLLAGCSKEKLQEVVEAAKVEPLVQSAAVVAEVIPATGRSEVQLGSSPLNATATYVRLYSIGDGRPNIVQWTSYSPEAGPQTYPAILARANTSATTLQSLAGQPLAPTIYVQASNGSPVLSSSDIQAIQGAVQAVNEQDKTLTLRVGPCQLTSPTGEQVAVQGITMEGVLP